MVQIDLRLPGGIGNSPKPLPKLTNPGKTTPDLSMTSSHGLKGYTPHVGMVYASASQTEFSYGNETGALLHTVAMRMQFAEGEPSLSNVLNSFQRYPLKTGYNMEKMVTPPLAVNNPKAVSQLGRYQPGDRAVILIHSPETAGDGKTPRFSQESATFKQVFQSLDYPPEAITILTDPSAEELKKALSVGAAGRNTTVWVAGHGETQEFGPDGEDSETNIRKTNDQGEGSDSLVVDLGEHRYSENQINNALANNPSNITLVYDTCFSGAGLSIVPTP